MSKQESITFEVEKDLEKPTEYLPTIDTNIIFQYIFTANKINKYYIKKIPTLKTLFYSMDTKVTEFYNSKFSSLIQGLIFAYKNHYPITKTPDMIWLLIEQGFVSYVEKYKDKVRENFVNFSGKKELKVERVGLTPTTLKEEDWKGIIDEFVQQIEENVGKEIIDNLQSDFSTTNLTSKITSKITIMSSFQEFFIYKLSMLGCGISSINLEGSLEDWKNIKSKLEYLSTKGLEWWTKNLIPIIDKIILTKKFYAENKVINEELINFWKKMIKVKGEGGVYSPYVINGWIVKFFPNLKGENPTIYEELKEGDVPDQIIGCPLEITFIPNEGGKIIAYKCNLISGFFGMIQDKNTFNVRPVIGYAIILEEENEYKISQEEKII